MNAAAKGMTAACIRPSNNNQRRLKGCGTVNRLTAAAIRYSRYTIRTQRRLHPISKRSSGLTARIEAKMFVPADGLGGEKPETKGAGQLKRLFTFVSIRIVQAQLEGLGNDGGFAPQVTGSNGEVQAPDYADLRQGMEEIPLGDGDSWIEAMLSLNPGLALRIIEVRSEYCREFDYTELQRLTDAGIEAGNTKLMRHHISTSSGLPLSSASNKDGNTDANKENR